MNACQFIYTNVESDNSPHHRRGFQSWLWTHGVEEFSDEVRGAVESLVGNFEFPPTPGEYVRRIFAPVAEGRFYVVAEARPNPLPDRFGRPGRFHAHALIVSAAEFRAEAGNDPFRIFEVFPFQKRPEGVEHNADWSKGHAPAVEVVPAEPREPILPADTAVSALAQWLVARPTSGPTVAIPLPTEAVEAWLRALFALLPVEFRPLASFDTLWPGRGKSPPALAGAWSAAMLGLWSYRNVIRYRPESGFHPHLPPAGGWRGRWMAEWAVRSRGTESVREGIWALSEWLFDRPDGPRPPAPEESYSAMAAEPAAREHFDKRRNAKIAAELPGRLSDLPSLRAAAEVHFGGWSLDGWEKLEAAVDNTTLGDWVDAARSELAALPRETAPASIGWPPTLDESPVKAVQWMAARWTPGFEQEVSTKLRSTDTVAEYLRKYCRRHLPACAKTTADAAGLLNAFLRGEEPCSREVVGELIRVCGPHGAGTERIALQRLSWLMGFQEGPTGEVELGWFADAVLPLLETGYEPVQRPGAGLESVSITVEAAAEVFVGVRIPWGRFRDFEWIVRLMKQLPKSGWKTSFLTVAKRWGESFSPEAKKPGDRELFHKIKDWMSSEGTEYRPVDLLGAFTDTTFHEFVDKNLVPRFYARFQEPEFMGSHPAECGWEIVLRDSDHREPWAALLRAAAESTCQPVPQRGRFAALVKALAPKTVSAPEGTP